MQPCHQLGIEAGGHRPLHAAHHRHQPRRRCIKAVQEQIGRVALWLVAELLQQGRSLGAGALERGPQLAVAGRCGARHALALLQPLGQSGEGDLQLIHQFAITAQALHEPACRPEQPQAEDREDDPQNRPEKAERDPAGEAALMHQPTHHHDHPAHLVAHLQAQDAAQQPQTAHRDR